MPKNEKDELAQKDTKNEDEDPELTKKKEEKRKKKVMEENLCKLIKSEMDE